jgi:two-component system, LytTR family, sensor kinase
MKVRWSLFVQTFFSVILIVKNNELITNYFNAQIMRDYAATFSSEGDSFEIIKNAILPQICTLLLFWGIYLATRYLLYPKLKKISFDNFNDFDSQNFVFLMVALNAFALLFALGVNCISFFAKPHLFNYKDFQLLALLGYNDGQTQNIFFGFGRAMVLVLGLLAYLLLRDKIIEYTERPSPIREYRILVANNFMAFVMFYFLGLFVFNPVHNDFLLYFACITPMMVLYLYFTFWLFPQQGDNPWTLTKRTEKESNDRNKVPNPHRNLYKRVLLVTFIGSLPQLQGYLFISNPLRFPIYWAFLLFIFTPICWILYQGRKEKIKQLRGMQQALVKSKADLQFLRSQINPHFLFNAMNTLYGTALREGAQNTADGIQKLGDMMRFMLHENNQDFIPMQKECEYLKNYISLQKMRIQSSENIILTDNIEENGCNNPIAPMILIPLVENAFKHGISLQGRSWIHIHLTCTADRVDFVVKNSLHQHRENDPEMEQSGIGLVNVVERLKLIYPEQHEFYYGAVGNEFIAKLTLKIN